MEHEICYSKIIYAFFIYIQMTQLLALMLNDHALKKIFNPLIVYFASSL